MQVHGLRGTKMQRKYPPKNRKASGTNCNKCKRYCCCLFVYLFICILLCFSVVLLHNMNMKCEMYSGMRKLRRFVLTEILYWLYVCWSVNL